MKFGLVFSDESMIAKIQKNLLKELNLAKKKTRNLLKLLTRLTELSCKRSGQRMFEEKKAIRERRACKKD